MMQHDGTIERQTMAEARTWLRRAFFVDIWQERKKASFQPERMTYLLDGGEKITQLKRLERLRILRDPTLLQRVHPSDLPRPDARKKSMQQIRRVVELRRTIHDPVHKKVFWEIVSRYDESLSMRLYVHYTLFYETILNQGTEEQYAKWKDDIENMRVIGCFAMTELGHSSFLRGLETTATYDPATREFVLHSPTLTSSKWWIGMAGQAATHTVALCQLLIGGQNHGVHWFIVPLRCAQDGHLLPGVSAGDIGAKAGRNGLDNGWIQFTNVRVPLENMLQRWARVSPAGDFTAPANAAISYNTLVGERIIALGGIENHLVQALTVAVRYGLVRRQGPSDEQIMDFPTHYAQLMPILAGAYGNHFVKLALYQRWEKLQLLAQQQQTQDEFLRALPDVHAVSASLKAHIGWWCADSLEICRRSLGGHAYSSYNAISGLMGDYGVMTTGGGDNYVLAQQHARYLVGAVRKAQQGKAQALAASSVAYLASASAAAPCVAVADAAAWDDPALVIRVYQQLAVKLLRAVATSLATAVGEGKDLETAWNEHMLDLIAASRVATYLFWIETYARGVEAVNEADLRNVLRKLCSLFGAWSLLKDSALFLEHGCVSAQSLPQLRARVLLLSREVRQDAASLIDAWDLPDWFVRAPLGARDGNIYAKYFAAVTGAPGGLDVAPYWDAEVRPLVAPARL